MLRRLAPTLAPTLAAFAALAACWPVTVPAKPLELHARPEVDLPFGEDVVFPAGPGADVASANCLTCPYAAHTRNHPPR